MTRNWDYYIIGNFIEKGVIVNGGIKYL